MSNSNKPGIPFWIIGVIALLWNGMGVNSYLQIAFKTEASTMDMNAEQIALVSYFYVFAFLRYRSGSA